MKYWLETGDDDALSMLGDHIGSVFRPRPHDDHQGVSADAVVELIRNDARRIEADD